jgi:uncharacterized membrane protein YqgA involved in biofilm formation
MFTSVAVLIIGVWMIVSSQEPVSATLTLVLGVLVGILAFLDLLPSVRSRV